MTSFRFLLPVALAALLAACASGPPAATDFPAGARTPNAAEVSTLLKGKSFKQSPGAIRMDYAADANTMTAFFSGNSYPGTWRAEDGRVCMEFKTITSACNDLRLVGKDIYLKRTNGRVVKLEPR